MRENNKDLTNKRENETLRNLDVMNQYDEGEDDYPLRDTFRNVLDSNIIGNRDEGE